MWRIPITEGLAKRFVPSISQQLDAVKAATIAATARPVDLYYSKLGRYVTGEFFAQGWGDLRVVSLEDDMKLMSTWPPPGLKLDWKEVERGRKDGVDYKLYEGVFKTPCVGRVYDALPPESRTARCQLLVPARPAPNLGAAVHLAATGDQGFGRRLRLAFPLLKQGICALVLESPFYGMRRPQAQQGAKLLRVSDLLTLGWATIYESINLLHWLEEDGYQQLCMTGLSMGGVHACMTAALYPKDVAVVPLLAPRSAAVAYCDGALAAAMAWEPLLREADERGSNVKQVVTHAAQPVSGMRAATFALAELELARDVGASGTMSDAAVAAAATYGGNAVRTPPMSPAPKQHAHHGHQAAHSSHAGSGSAHAGAGSGSSSSSSSGRSHGATGSHASEADVGRGPPRGSSEHTPRPHAVEHAHHAHARSDHNRQQGHPHDHQQHHHAHEQQQQQEQVQQPGPGLAGAQASSQAPPRRSRRILPIDIPLQLPGLAGKQAAELQAVMSKVERGMSELLKLRAGDHDMHKKETLRRLKWVLETFTDITRFPVPRRPDTAVFVAAKDDGYVALESVQKLHSYYPGSELRMVSGGHVSAFLMHQDHFRQAILDSMQRLEKPAPQPTGNSSGQLSQPQPAQP